MDLPIIVALAGRWISLLVTISIAAVFGYRLLLHPLQKYPGPPAAKLSDAYNGWYSFRKRLHLTSIEDHAKYGPVMRHGPNKLLFNTATALHDIYDNDRIVKSYINSAIIQTPGVYSLFTVIDRDAHRTKRRIVGSVVNDRSMRIFEPTMQEQVDLFIKHLSECATRSEPVNMTQRVTYLACDVIALLALGFPLKLQSEERYRFMVGGMFRANHLANTRMQWFRLHQLRVFSLLNYFTRDTREQYKRMIEAMIKSRLSEAKDVRHDLFSIVSTASSQGEDIRVSDVWTEVVSFFPAGAFSTSAGICALFFYLSHNKTCYDKLVAEIRSTFASSSEICAGPKLSGCQYLRACIDEALRTSPPVPGTLWREVAAEEKGRPVFIDGQVIPPNTQVGVNIYALHHNEKYFPDPFTFKPERWLPSETSAAERERMNEAFTPFSIGYRGCAGKPMAYLETSLVIAKTLWHFDFELAPGELGKVGEGVAGRTDGRGRPDEYQLYDVIAGQHDGPYLVFKPHA
ncbi:cytochrome P450 [Xylariaceae sp. FL0594]|nr:cytochrome P450 [Xylariaceae sp. FL0594]